MRKWDVYFTATKLFKGLELDFVENPPTSDDPNLARNDVLDFQITLRRQHFDGMVTEVRPDGDVIVMAQSSRWRISPATEADKVHPMALRTKPHIWFIREEIG
jgi:hypothetical protein